MKKALKTLAASVLIVGALASGCSYAGVGVTADGKAVIARNDAFLFGILRQVSVCTVTPAGLSECSTGEAP